MGMERNTRSPEAANTFKVKAHFSNDATETMEDKILRLIRNEADTNDKVWYNGYAPDEPSGLKGVQQ